MFGKGTLSLWLYDCSSEWRPARKELIWSLAVLACSVLWRLPQGRSRNRLRPEGSRVALPAHFLAGGVVMKRGQAGTNDFLCSREQGCLLCISVVWWSVQMQQCMCRARTGLIQGSFLSAIWTEKVRGAEYILLIPYLLLMHLRQQSRYSYIIVMNHNVHWSTSRMSVADYRWLRGTMPVGFAGGLLPSHPVMTGVPHHSAASVRVWAAAPSSCWSKTVSRG